MPNGSRAVALLIFCCLGIAPAVADDAAPAATETDTLTVTAEPVEVGHEIRRPAPGDDLRRTLDRSAFQLIRRGAGASSDLYADGLKRGDIVVTIDGERFTTACPNRMDTRAGHVDLNAMVQVELDRTAGSLQSGLGGQLAFKRRLPGEATRVSAAASGALDHGEELDLGGAVESRRLRASLRLRRLGPWTDADDGTFEDLYGYAEAPTAEIYEAQLVKAFDGGDAVGTFETSRDLLFPYLRMDERENEHYQASVGWREHRFYVNYNDHMMDNGLRTSLNMMDMRTDATNTMIGLTGPNYELWARNWDADNRIVPAANPAMGIDNRMLPDVWRVAAAYRHELGARDGLHLALRAGLSHTSVGDESQADRYDLLLDDADTDRWSVPFGATFTHGADLGADARLQAALEVASDPPAIEALYINVDKPGTSPTWLGNPELDNPLRGSARAELQVSRARLEVFAHRIWDYVYPDRIARDGQAYQTYKPVNALLLGAGLNVGWQHLDLAARWNWGADTDDWDPLAEIQPLMFSADARSPWYGKVRARARYEHAVGQDRVDSSLNELTSRAWDRVDLGLEMATGPWTVQVDLENALNERYAQHLSYLRDPFAAGALVREPGRTVRLGATYRP